MKVVALLSGGLDSTTMVAEFLAQGHEVVALTLRYGSKHQDAEIGAARRIAEHYRLQHIEAPLPRVLFGNSALIDKELPMGRDIREMIEEAVNPTYVPGRNATLLMCANSLRETLGYDAVSYAAHATDGTHYIDTTPEFLSDADRLVRHYGGHIMAPYINCHKHEVVSRAAEFRAPLALTHSCYKGTTPACALCDTCVIRIAAFKRAGYIDPIEYVVPLVWSEECEPWPV